jgi:cytidylate kinase
MAIITVSRGTFSGGKRLATCLGTTLGYRIISREVLVEAAERYGVKEKELERGITQAPTLWERFSVDRQMYLAAVTATLCTLVRGDNVVYHGYAGHLLLAGVKHVMRVRAIAPAAYRMREAVASHGFDEKRAAAYIQRMDEERIAWTHFLYGVEWQDPALYDVVVNLEKVTVGSACQTIAELAERPEFRATATARRTLDDLLLANHVKARLFLNPRVGAAAARVEVAAHSGTVRLSGLLPADAYREEVLRTVRELEEVRAVHADSLAGHVESL